MGNLFFFAEVKRELRRCFKNVFDSKYTADEIRAGVEKLNKSYGWYGTVNSIAKTGFFTHGNNNAFKSVMLTNLYEIFHWWSYELAQIQYHQNLIEQQKR